MQQHDQADAEDHVLEHGPGRGLDQVLAVIDALDMHTRRKDGGIVDALDELLDPGDGGRALLAAPHQHDPLHDVVVAVLARDAEPRLFADGDGGDVLDQHRRSVGRRDHGVGERVDGADQADAAHHRRLLSDIDGVAADIDVGVADGLQQLRQRQPVRHQLVEIDLQLVGLGAAAPAGDVDDAGHGAEAALQHPVLQGLQVKHGIIGRTDQPVAIDFTDRTERRYLRLRAVEKRRHLRQPVQHLLQRLLVGEVERELQLDVGQAVQRNRPYDIEVLEAGDLGLQRNGDVAFDLLGRQTRRLGDDVDHRRRRIGIGLDVQLLKRHEAADEDGQKQPEHQEAAFDSKGYQTVHSGGLCSLHQVPEAARSMNRLPLTTIFSPAFRLVRTSTRSPLIRPVLISRSSSDLSSCATQRRTRSAS